MKVKRLNYFVEYQHGASRELSEQEYHQKKNEYMNLCWDYDEFSRNFINTKDYVQYENCITFYLNDISITFGYGQREIY